MLCPELESLDDMTLKGDISMLEAKIAEFRVNKCSNESRAAQGKTPCKSDEEIDDYVKDIEIETWTI